VVKRARDAGLVEIRIHNLRDWTSDRHKDRGRPAVRRDEGMVLKPEPVFAAAESIWPRTPSRIRRWCCFRRQGRLFDQGVANRLSRESGLLICGRYEGVDDRVAAHLADDEISIGITCKRWRTGGGGVIDAVARLVAGMLGNESSAALESSRKRVRRKVCWMRTGPGRRTSVDGSAGSALERQPPGRSQVFGRIGAGEDGPLRPDLLAGPGMSDRRLRKILMQNALLTKFIQKNKGPRSQFRPGEPFGFT